jgi:hypothetical protein
MQDEQAYKAQAKIDAKAGVANSMSVGGRSDRAAIEEIGHPASEIKAPNSDERLACMNLYPARDSARRISQLRWK